MELYRGLVGVVLCHGNTRTAKCAIERGVRVNLLHTELQAAS